MKELNKLLSLVSCLALAIIACIKPEVITVYADQGSSVQPVTLTTRSVVSIDDVFGDYMSTVDENIYYSLSSVNSQTLISIYGAHDTPMFNMAKETINPCMALATTWGEAGRSSAGVSLTTVMDFSPDTYVEEINWITLSKNLEQVDSSWYITNTKKNYNTNTDGKAYHMPNNLLQYPSGGNRSTSAMTGLGVGPYQTTSSDWDKWDLDNRVNPVWAYSGSLQKCGSSWINCGITPISDLTVYACLSLGHQGGGLISYDFGKQLINVINRQDVQDAFNQVGYQVYLDTKEKAYNKSISLDDINIGKYLPQVEALCGINFSDYTGGPGRTNKGNYTATHCLRYVFYKYYFTGGL